MATFTDDMTAQDWHAFLSGRELHNFDIASRSPQRLISDANGERSFTRDYQGREILEMLQNANDAAADQDSVGRVHIELSETALIVANTGTPFPQKGFDSLQFPHLSPKRASRRFVGNKGLGFRAILNWTRCPCVLSGNMAVAFSEDITRAKQEILRNHSKELSEIIDDEERRLGGSLVIPLLLFPGFRAGGDLSELLTEPEQRRAYLRCRELREEFGFDTAIGMRFARHSDFEAAQQQLAYLHPEVLLFTTGLSEITISVDGQPMRHWVKEECSTDRLRIRDGGEIHEWRIFPREGKLPPEGQARDAGDEAADYQIMLAIPTTATSRENYLFTYFPTEVRFPYPVLCHATLDLQANRQQLQSTPANHFVLRELADLMAETAETLAQEKSGDEGLRLVAGNSQSDPLEKFGFRRNLLEATRHRRIVPTIAGSIVSPVQARRVPCVETAFLPAQSFANVARLTVGSLTDAQLESLGVPVFDKEEWLRSGGNIYFQTLTERSEYISGLIRHRIHDLLPAVGLLLDQDGAVVPTGVRIFLPDAGRNTWSLPSWFKVRFLQPELWDALTKRLDPRNQEEMAARLAPFEVLRYSLDAVLRAVSAQAAARLREAPEEQHPDIRHELLQALFALYPKDESAEKQPRFPPNVAVYVPTLIGTFEEASRVYLGEDFGLRGRILHGLYHTVSPEKLLAAKAAAGISAPQEVLARFFVWLGVADLPRRTIDDQRDPQFLRLVLDGLRDSVYFGEYKLPVTSLRITEALVSRCQSIDGFYQFLAEGETCAVLAWLAYDPRTLSWRLPAKEHGCLGYWPDGARRFHDYDGPIQSYVRWKLRTTTWLPLGSQRVAPQDCLAEAAGSMENLLPAPPRFSAEALSRYELNQDLLRTAYDAAGVIPGFSQIETERLYELLAQLPERDPQGKAARGFYRAVLARFDEPVDSGLSPARVRFHDHGRMWGENAAGEGYFPVQTLLHADSEDIPPAICRKFNIAALPKRRGNAKIERIFGVRPIERSQILRRVDDPIPLREADEFNRALQHLKPLIGALRAGEKTSGAQEFEQMQIIVCSKLRGEVSYAGQSEPVGFNAWDWIIDDGSGNAYIQVDPNTPDPLNSSLLADAIGQIVAATFRVEKSDEFARLIGCRETERLEMLRRLLGENQLANLEEIGQAYRATLIGARRNVKPLPEAAFLPPIFASTSPTIPTANVPESNELAMAIPEDVTVPVQISRREVNSDVEPRAVACQVTRRISSSQRTERAVYQVTNGDYCEYKAMEFEANDSPPRFPLRVGQVRGYEAPGVDVLSFATEADCRLFQDGKGTDESLVARFIEVKGRASAGAVITLKGNALERAKYLRDRYYIYRFIDNGGGSCDIAVLRNPLAAPTGVETVYEVNLSAATSREEFMLTGGVTESNYLQPIPDLGDS